jgi:hypothetical protein
MLKNPGTRQNANAREGGIGDKEILIAHIKSIWYAGKSREFVPAVHWIQLLEPKASLGNVEVSLPSALSLEVLAACCILLHHLIFSYSRQVHTCCESLKLEVRIAGKGMSLMLSENVSM